MDCQDLVITAIERFPGNYESASRLVKEAMDKKYNESWVVVMGQGFAFEVTHEVKHVLWMFYMHRRRRLKRNPAKKRPAKKRQGRTSLERTSLESCSTCRSSRYPRPHRRRRRHLSRHRRRRRHHRLSPPRPSLRRRPRPRRSGSR